MKILVLFCFLINQLICQNIGVNSTGATPDPSAILDVSANPSNDKGFLMPRLTNTQRKAIASPAVGLMVYDLTLKGIYIFDGAKWDCAQIPAGTVDYFANITSPNGFLECNGQAVSRTVYTELFSAIGTLYGVGDGSTTFNVPDLRGEFIRGWDNGRGADATRAIASKQVGTLIVGDIDGISTTNAVTLLTLNPASGFNTVGADPVTATDYTPNTVGFTNLGPASVVSFDSRPDVFGVSRPRNVALMPCIKF